MGDDILLRFWDLASQGGSRYVRLYALGSGLEDEDPQPSAVCFAPDGESVAVGFRHGQVWILPGPGSLRDNPKRCGAIALAAVSVFLRAANFEVSKRSMLAIDARH